MCEIISIRSGGQTGADRAALDAARAAGVPVHGWVPKGGWAEDKPCAPGIVADYPTLKETKSADTSERTVLNVRDSDATLVIDPEGSRSPGTDLTLRTAIDLGKPVMVYGKQNVKEVLAWLDSIGDKIDLNIAGPRESEVPGTYDVTYALIESLLGSA